MAVLPTGIGPVTGYNIERSLRFNSADSAYLSRTPASATNQKTWTWSAWVKRSVLGATKVLFDARGAGSNPVHAFYFNSSDQLAVFIRNASATVIGNYNTSAVFRDLSAWYYITYKFDSTQATATNRVQIYVNGVLQSITASTTISQNADAFINSAISHGIGAEGVTPTDEFDGYMTEVNFVDSPVLLGSTTNASTTITLTTGTTTNIGIGWNVGGTNIPSGATVSSITNSTQFVISSAATATGSSISIGVAPPVSAFGETDSATGVWKPKAYSGSYGTNGFYLKFADNSGTTSTTLGKDSSGNGNNWTPNNFSVTAGAGNDSLVDSPTSYGTDTGVGGEVRGNYATLNPLRTSNAPTNGNLDVSFPTASRQIGSTIALPSSGKWYFEATLTALSAPAAQVGVSGLNYSTTNYGGQEADSYVYSSGAQKANNNSFVAYGASWTTNDVIGVAADVDAGSLTFYKNGVSQGAAYTGISLVNKYFVVGMGGTSINFTVNFGQRAFAYTAPSGFKALCTQNLPTPTIGATSTTQANDYFNAVLYTGNGTTNTITGVGFQPDFVWAKARSVANWHILSDVVRGATSYLHSNNTDAEGTNSAVISSFNSDGFTLGSNTTINGNGDTNVAWNWKANGAGSSNTAGTITSTVSANTTSGFSIVTYTGNGTNGATVGHGLGTTPAMVIIKSRSLTGTAPSASWIVWHRSISQAIQTSTTIALTGFTGATVLNSTTQSTTYGFDAQVNGSTQTYVAYCFAPVDGYSAFGSYTGNGAADGPFVYTGFRPRYVLIKKTATGTGNAEWYVHDTARDDYNQARFKLYPSSAVAENGVAGETTTTNAIDILSNGFKLRTLNGATNESAIVYIYAAFAEHPFKYSLAR